MFYREVKVSERLPEKDAKVYTDVGLADYCGNDNWIVEYPEDGGFVFGINVVKWWLEPIDLPEDIEYDAYMAGAKAVQSRLPTEEEIDKLWYKFADTENDFGNLFLGRDSYDLLIDELINLLKG